MRVCSATRRQVARALSLLDVFASISGALRLFGSDGLWWNMAVSLGCFVNATQTMNENDEVKGTR